jgi:2-keto-4-pentenoate hydratase
MSSVEQAADRLWSAWTTGVPCPPVRDLIGSEDVGAAYEVQRVNVARQETSGDRVVGYKIGLTSEAVQAQLGVDQPDLGPLFASRAHEDGSDVDMGRLIAPRIEAEVALVLGEPLDPGDIDEAAIAAATSHVVAALEVVDSRVEGWDITITDTVADFASGAAFVLGDRIRRLEDVELPSVPMELRCDGEVVSRGSGAATLGNPLTAAVWLARALERFGTPLAAGDVILTGALGPFADLSADSEIRADLGPLGSVTCHTTRRES